MKWSWFGWSQNLEAWVRSGRVRLVVLVSLVQQHANCSMKCLTENWVWYSSIPKLPFVVITSGDFRHCELKKREPIFLRFFINATRYTLDSLTVALNSVTECIVLVTLVTHYISLINVAPLLYKCTIVIYVWFMVPRFITILIHILAQFGVVSHW